MGGFEASGQPPSGARFCNIAIPHTRLDELTYEFEPERFPDLAPGACVQVRLRGRKVKGIVLELLARSPVPKTLPVEKLIEPVLVDDQLLRLLRWVGAYYFGRMGEVLGLALPRGVCGYGLRRQQRAAPIREREGQAAAVRDRRAAVPVFAPAFAVHVQTEPVAVEDVVVGFVAQGLDRGTVIAMMPESETGRWTGVLRSRLGVDPVRYHGEQKASERKRAWRGLRSARRSLVLGVRSAVFAPVPDLAGIVVLDEHDKVYKEERHPRINARDVAVARARLRDCPVLLCDQTPSAETWLNLRSGQYMPVSGAPSSGPAAPPAPTALPDTIVVDMRKHRDALFAPVLVNELREAGAAGESAVLYVNRRGLSRYVVCRDCGTPLSCPGCAVSFVLVSEGDLRCRYCGRSVSAPATCPTCGSPDFRFRIPGVEMAAREVSRFVPEVPVAVIMSENVASSAVEPGTFVVGTRALLSLDWPERVRVVADLAADADLCLPDFRARERTFQVLSALSRSAVVHRATFVVQTRHPDDAAITYGVERNPAGFLEEELKLREELGFPPFRRLVLVELSAQDGDKAERRGEWLVRRLCRPPGVEALGPVPVRGRTSAVQVVVKVARNVRLDRLITIRQLEADGVRVRIDVDPLDTL